MSSGAATLWFTLILLSLNTGQYVDGGAMLDMFNAMQELMEGEGEFDPVYYEKLVQCMASVDEDLVVSQDAAWQGMIDYWNGNDTRDDDFWGQTDSNYKENDPTSTSTDGMIIYEPCNYASNMASYHPVTEICERMKNHPFYIDHIFVTGLAQGFSMLSAESSFWHGSHTHLGQLLDNTGITVVAYVMHQASLSSLEDPPNILYYLQEDVPDKNSTEIAQAFTDMFLSPVSGWMDTTTNMNVPDYYKIFGGLVCTILTIAIEDDSEVDNIVNELAELFHVDDAIVKFINDDYLPAIRTATSELDMPPVERVKFIGNTVGTIAKLLYAFLWQEHIIDISSGMFLCPFLNGVGWNFLPELNMRLSQFQTFRYYEFEFQTGTNIYPGENECNPVIPHAKWHLQSAIGLLDLAYLAEETHRLLSTYNNPSNHRV